MTDNEHRNPHVLNKKLKPLDASVELKIRNFDVLGQDDHKETSPSNIVIEKPSDDTLLDKIKNNYNAGIIVALVNLPLSISLAVAARSTPQAGVITAIVSGLVSGLLGGSHYNIVGPTGALSGFLASAVMKYQSDTTDPLPDVLPVFALFTGILVFIVLAFKLNKYIELFPSSVNEGFTLGVAIIIFCNQLNFAFGVTPLHRHESLLANVYESLALLPELNPPSFIMCTLWLVGFFVLIKRFPKIPWATVLCALGIFIGWIVNPIPSINLPTLFDKFGNLSFDGYLGIKGFRGDMLSLPTFYVELMPITFVAVLETLISAKIADKMTNTKFEQIPEMVALGLANILSGLCGGIPATAALARTALNIKSGCTNKMASLINSFIMLVLCIFLFSMFKYLPLAVVASQVMVVAIRMVDYHALEFYWHADREQFWIMIVVAAISVVIDTTYGLIIGMFLYLFLFAEKMMEAFSEITISSQSKPDFQIVTSESLKEKKKIMKQVKGPGSAGVGNFDDIVESKLVELIEDVPQELLGVQYVLYRFVGVINFMNMVNHEEKIKLLPDTHALVLSMRFIYLMDSEAVGALKQMFEKLEKSGKKVYFTGITENHLLTLSKYNNEWLDYLLKHDKIHNLPKASRYLAKKNS